MIISLVHLKIEYREFGPPTSGKMISKKSMGTTRALRAIILCLLFIIIAMTVAIVLLYLETTDEKFANNNEVAQNEACPNGEFVINPHLNDDTGIFHELNEVEIRKVEQFMNDMLNISNKTPVFKKSKYIVLIDVLYPSKKDVLEYLDRNGTKPTRKARVAVMDGHVLSDYVVSPVHEPKQWKLISYSDRVNPAENNLGRYNFPDFLVVLRVTAKITTQLWKIFQETYDDFKDYSNSLLASRDGFDLRTFDPHVKVDKHGVYLGVYGTQRAKTISLFQRYTMLYYIVNVTSSSSSDWNIDQIVYNNISYPNVSAIMEAYNNKTLTVVKVPSLPQEEFERERLKGTYSGQHENSEPSLSDQRAHRFSVTGRKIKYLNWEFEYGVRTLTGPGVFDVRFRNKRIAYEVSLQEYASFFSSAGPLMSSDLLLHSLYGLGKTVPLVKGIDCPGNAVYLDGASYFNLSPRTDDIKESIVTKNAICMFESKYQLPLRRHTVKNSEFGGMTGTTLITRFVLDIAKSETDVIVDYIFHQNGVLEVKATVTGIPSVSFKYDGVENGYEFYKNHIGMIHDDFLLFKTDLDIDGENNSFQTLSVSTEMHKDGWESEPFLKKRLRKNQIHFEKDAAIRENSSFDYFVFYNENSKNRYNNSRGYRLHILSSTGQVYPDDHISTLNAEWTKYKIAVTKYNEQEESANCLLNSVYQKTPAACSFDQRINDTERISNTDLVAWVTIGGLQIPTTEDIPTITTTGSQYSFLLRPFNYFDEDPSAISPDSVYFNSTTVFTQTGEGMSTIKKSCNGP